MNKSRWIAHERIMSEDNVNLLCFTYPGGSASNFATWKKSIDERINLIPILYPEREIRKNDEMEENFNLFVDHFIEQNEELLKKPYAFFGYYGGAVIAYEICIKVKELYGIEPIWGFVASSEAPEYLRDSLVAFPDKDAKQDITDYLVGLGMFDENVVKSKIFLEYYVPMLKADCRMLDTYKFRNHEKMECGLNILYGKEDSTVRYEKTLKWKDVTNGEVIFEECAGGHFFVDMQKEYVCQLINARLIDR